MNQVYQDGIGGSTCEDCEGCPECPPVPSYYRKGDAGVDALLEEYKAEAKASLDGVMRERYKARGYPQDLVDGLVSRDLTNEEIEKKWPEFLKRDPVEAAASKAKQLPFVDSPLIAGLVKRGWTENQALGLIAKVADNPEIASRFPEFFPPDEANAPKAYDSHVRDLVLKGDGRITALLQRNDGKTLMYAGKVNSLFGEPSAGKSWVALIAAYETILMGGRVLWWDFEDDTNQLATRSTSLGILEFLQNQDSFKFCDSSLQDPSETQARQELNDWLTGADNSLVVIDAAESAGCPSDGKDVAPWYREMVNPWKVAGIGVLVLDHVPKQRIDRPLGPIGSNHKRAAVNGSSVFVSGTPWNKSVGGGIKLTNHKDRNGDLPAGLGKTIALITGEYVDGVLQYKITPPSKDTEDVMDDVSEELLEKIAATGFDGVRGQRAVRALLKANHKAVDAALVELLSNGLVAYTKVGQTYNYCATDAGKEVVGG